MIAACLIVKNSVGTIERTLASIRPFLDEVNVFDTGSDDGTPELLRRLNAEELFACPMCGQAAGLEYDTLPSHWTPRCECVLPDGVERLVQVPLAPIRVKVGKDVPLSEDGGLADFAWAREQSFAMASPEHEWLFWLDDDDELVGGQQLRPVAATAHRAVDGYVLFYDYAQDELGNNVCCLWRERLIRRHEGWGWRNPVHEVWLPEEGNEAVPTYVSLPPQQMKIVHRRPADRYPSTRNLTILERLVETEKAAGREPDLRTRAYVGTELMAHGRFAEAVPWFQSYVDDPASTVGDERSQVWHKLAFCFRLLNELMAALEAEFNAVKERDDWAENAVGLAEIFALMQRFDRSALWAKRALDLGQPQSMLILNPHEFTLVPWVRLAEACMHLERFEEAEKWLAQAGAVAPGHPFVQAIAAELASTKQQTELVRAALLLREHAVRCDENLKALAILENVPYMIDEHPLIVRTRAMSRENVMHALKPAEYTRWYEDDPKESTVPDEWVPNAGEAIERAKFLLELARRFEAEHGRKPRMLDLGCNDAWMAGYLWTNGEYACDGIELNKASVEKAAGRVERFGMPGRVVQGNIFDALDLLAEPCDPDPIATQIRVTQRYDIVSCFEVYEHVPDTDDLLALMESLLTPEGAACVTTPNGAFERGNIQMWHLVERKGHLRAVPAHELARQLSGRGEITDFRVHDGERLTFAAWRPRLKRGKVIFFGGNAWEPWSPASIKQGGLGGSETALSLVTCRLAQQGFEVNVYCDAQPGLYGGGVWRPASAFDPTEEADAVVISRQPTMFDVPYSAPVRALWCHDHSYPDLMTEARAERMTDVLVLSDWQRERFARLYPYLEEKLRVQRNGIFYVDSEGGPNYPAKLPSFAAREPRVVYSSSADRGLDVLLELWPQIKLRVPEAELHVFYGWDVFDAVARMAPHLRGFKAHVEMLYERAGGEEGGIFFRGRVGQDELRAEFLKARVWGYPTYFLETSCIGAMEARAAGLACVTSDLGALAETVGEHGILLPWGADEDERHTDDGIYRESFVNGVSELLTKPALWTQWSKRSRTGARYLDWNERVAEWAAMIEGVRAALPAAVC